MKRLFLYLACLVVACSCNDTIIEDSIHVESEPSYYLPEVTSLLQDAEAYVATSSEVQIPFEERLSRFEYLKLEAEARGIDYRIERDDSIQIISFATKDANIRSSSAGAVVFQHGNADVGFPFTTIILLIDYDYDTYSQKIIRVNYMYQDLQMGKYAVFDEWSSVGEFVDIVGDTTFEYRASGHIIFHYDLPWAPEDVNTTVDKIYSVKDRLNVRPQV